MNNQQTMDQINKMLNFVAGKRIPDGMRGYDQRLSSWLLMASDLIPFSGVNQHKNLGDISQTNQGNMALSNGQNNTFNQWDSSMNGMNCDSTYGVGMNNNQNSQPISSNYPMQSSDYDYMNQSHVINGNNCLDMNNPMLNINNTIPFNTPLTPLPNHSLPLNTNTNTNGIPLSSSLLNSTSINTLPSVHTMNNTISSLDNGSNNNNNTINTNNYMYDSSFPPTSNPMINNTINSTPLNNTIQTMNNNSLSLSYDGTIDSMTDLKDASNTKRVHEDEDSKDSKRIKRLEKNREIAKNCRKRKKEKIIALEEEIQQLRQANDDMKRQMFNNGQNTDKERVQSAYVSKLRELLLARASDEEVQKEIDAYYDNWKKNNEDRFNNSKFHLEQLKMLLLPTQVTKMCVWSLQQDDEFYDEKLNDIKYGGSIWTLLCNSIDMTNEQKLKILSLRNETNEGCQNMDKIIDIIEMLQEKISENMSISRQQLEGIMKVLTPRQQAKFLLWCEDNKNKNQLLSILFSILHKTQDTEEVDTDSSDDNNA